MAQNIVFKITADTSGFDEGLKKTGTAVDDVGKKTKKATEEVGVFQNALGKIGGVVAGAFAVSSIIAFGKEVAKTRAEIESLTTRISDIKGSQEAGNKAMDELRQTANALGIEFKQLATNYASFVGGAKASGMEISKAEKIFKSMTIAIKGSGANAETANRAFTALTQMIGKGKIQAEELRGQLGEAMPAAFGIMAKSLGVTTQELDKMMASGNLIASEVLPKFAKEMENAYGANAQKMASGLSSEIARMGNKWDELLETVGRTGAIEASISLLTYGIEGLSASVAMLTGQWAEYQQAVINAERASQLDAEGKRIDAQIQKRIETLKQAGLTEDEINQELTASYNKYVEEVEEGDRRIEASQKKLFGGGIVITEQSVRELELKRATRDILLDSINSLKDTGVVQASNTKLTKDELRAIEALRKERERLNELELDRLLQATQLSAIDPFEYQIAEATFDADIEEKRVKAENKMLDEVFKANEQALAERHQYGEISEEDYLRKRLELYEQFGKDVRKVEAEITEYEKNYSKERTKQTWTEAQTREFALSQTLNTMDALNNAYTISQTNQLQEQLEKGLIGQEQYEASLRKIKRRQAVLDKAGALFNIAINTAQGVSSAAGSVLGLPLAPVIGKLGAIQAGIVLTTPIPYNKGTKKVPMMRGAIRGKDSVHAILTPNERVVPEDINTQPGYSALMDLAHDRKISDKEAGFIAKLATGGVYASQNTAEMDYNQLGKSIAKYIPHTDVRIDHNGIAVITDRSHANMSRLKTRL